MRLYVTPKGRWAGTQADAKKMAHEDGGWEQREVPTDKEGLLTFLNCMQVDAMHDEAKAMVASVETLSPHKVASTNFQERARQCERLDQLCSAASPLELADIARVVVGRIEELAELVRGS